MPVMPGRSGSERRTGSRACSQARPRSRAPRYPEQHNTQHSTNTAPAQHQHSTSTTPAPQHTSTPPQPPTPAHHQHQHHQPTTRNQHHHLHQDPALTPSHRHTYCSHIQHSRTLLSSRPSRPTTHTPQTMKDFSGLYSAVQEERVQRTIESILLSLDPIPQTRILTCP
jgi:hypothetical protein